MVANVCISQDAMGRHVSNPALTKLPAPLFEDYSPGGALCQILASAYRVKTEQSWWVRRRREEGEGNIHACSHLTYTGARLFDNRKFWW